MAKLKYKRLNFLSLLYTVLGKLQANKRCSNEGIYVVLMSYGSMNALLKVRKKIIN